MKYTTNTDFTHQKLQLLRDRYELQAVLMQKAEAVRLQRYNAALELRVKQHEIQDRLALQLAKLKDGYEKTELLPKNLLQVVYLDNLLAEFQCSDPRLAEKLQTLHRFVQLQRLDASNHDEKTRESQVYADLVLVEEAYREFKRLHEASTFTLKAFATS